MADELNKKIDEYIKNMPSLPTSVVKVLEVCNNPQTSPADLNHVISLDPVLVGRVLKLINSAYYGIPNQVTSLVRAIIMLGINTVKNLALSTAVMGNLSSRKYLQGLDMEGFWRHSLCVGVSAKILARRRGIDSKQLEEYFTAGLLHDIGKIPLNAVLSKEYMLTVSAADRERISLFQAEERTLGMNHCAVGARIVRAWKLEGPVGDTILYHHNPGEYQGSQKDVLCSIVAANHFAAMMGIGFSGDMHPGKTDPLVWGTLGVTMDVFEEIETTVNTEIEKAQIFLKLGAQ
ncbi:MAG: HDOD domain-containing protein [Treponema sp.]|jgi:putative nucleotidyltransferase with HDIG domain|nr:HDOD domain-containing protein [Treponema sp.]